MCAIYCWGMGPQYCDLASLLTVLYSNVSSLFQTYGELCKRCSMIHPKAVCSTETHLYQDAVDTIYHPGYVIASRCNRTK